MSEIIILHGIGHAERAVDWHVYWENLVRNPLEQYQRTADVFAFAYDDLFESARYDAEIMASGGIELLRSLGEYGLGDVFGFSRDRGGWSPMLRWVVGMVAQWAALPDLREQLKERLAEAIKRENPRVILGHSLGSLIAYDLFSDVDRRNLLDGRLLVTLGSQIGHPAVRSAFGGRVTTLSGSWMNLYNRLDRAFSVPIHPAGSGEFLQIATEFDSPTIFNHEPEGYLTHQVAREMLWPTIVEALDSPAERLLALSRTSIRSLGADFTGNPAAQLFAPVAEVRDTKVKKKFRAVLIGIDEYENSSNNLEGCVNDQFELSAVLQEFGFGAENIRALFNRSATASGILDRLKWLFDDAKPGDTLVLGYSGHGARITPRGVDGRPLAHVECLVPADCDWTPATMISDAKLLELYADLPYEVNLIMFLDCCHAGGVWRDIGAKIRGLAPPDDLRHESIRWDAKEQMWCPRVPIQLDPQNLKFKEDRRLKEAMVGASGNVRRIGRAYDARLNRADFESVRSSKGHEGPYTPVVFQACRDDQSASEYRHGSVTYGVFSYALTRALRRVMHAPSATPVSSLVRGIRQQLRRLNYDQDPEVYGPEHKLQQNLGAILGISNKN